MWKEDDARFFGLIFLVTLSVVATVVLLWEPTYIRDTEDHHSIDPQISSHPLQSNIVEDVIDNFRIHDEAVQEVEIFLAELRRSAFTQPSSIPSNIVRQEYISNLLITKTVGMSIASHSTQCAICLGDYQAGDIICSSHNSKCTHHFHQTCIFEWLLQDRDDCPCCRNNYLALSDDDDDDDDDDNTNNNNNDEYMEHSNHGSNYINEPSQNQTDTTQFLASRNDDWIPSYLAPFHSTTHDIETHNEQHRISTARSSSDLMTSVHVGRWSDDDDGEDSRSTDPDISDVDAWSCPSVEESVEEPYDVDTYRRRLQLRKRQGTHRSPRAVNESNNEQTQSLQLDDLILEGLMQHLQDRAEEQSTRTASSSSIYTEGAGDVEAPPNTGILSNLLRDESEVCAICCTEYAVNEELCWSQDPACSHVFHRRCMQQWISEKKDYCPFCRVQYDENRSSFPFTTPTSLPDSSQQGQCHATFHPSSNNDEAATGRSYFEFSRRNESDCTSEVSAASLLSINMDLVAEA